MAVSGLLLLVVLRPALPESRIIGKLIAIAIFGFVGTQVSYLAAIQYSNAPTATLLQFLFLPMVAGYEALTGALRWSSRWTAILVFAGVGTLLLIGIFSGGGFKVLITPIGLISGLLAAVTAAYYSLASRKIIRERGSWWLLTWGFIIGGIVTFPLGIFSLANYTFPTVPLLAVFGLVLFVIIFGTILSFGLYLSGLRRLPATEIGVVALFRADSCFTRSICVPWRQAGSHSILRRCHNFIRGNSDGVASGADTNQTGERKLPDQEKAG